MLLVSASLPAGVANPLLHTGQGEMVNPRVSTCCASTSGRCFFKASMFPQLRRQNVLLSAPPSWRVPRRFSVYCLDKPLQADDTGAIAAYLASEPKPFQLELNGGTDFVGIEYSDSDKEEPQLRSRRFENNFLSFTRLGSLITDKLESFFKSEIRRRLFVTAVLVVVSRIGYFIPLPGFDRRLMPEDYLSFPSGSMDHLGDFTAELKLSLFQLGISPQIAASILMQVLCHIVPSLVKMRKEGLDAHGKIKSYIWWASLGFAILEAVIVSCYSLPYSVYAANYRVRHVIITSFYLVLGAMTTTWICDTISEAGFGQGSSLIICMGILTGYSETLYEMFSQFSGSAMNWFPGISALIGVFTVMWAVLVTQGCRKIRLQYYAFKLASAARNGSPVMEVEPYIPFNINPSGMQPILATSYLFALPAILSSFDNSPFWENVRQILNPETSLGAQPWVYYSLYAFFVFLFNVFDIANVPKEISDYLSKMGARIPGIKPGKATVEYLAKVQASTRFWGGLLLSALATSSTIFDRYLRRTNMGFTLGFTSVLIIVGSIIELRRSYEAYNVMPALGRVLKRYGA